MKGYTFIPTSADEAQKLLLSVHGNSIDAMSKARLVKAWCAAAYLYPIHPDDFDESSSDWPEVVRTIAAEMLRRHDRQEIGDEDLYQSDAAWAGVYDLMTSHTPEETRRRKDLAAQYSHA